MKKYEIYLPLKYNDGREIEAEKIKQIREELVGMFGARTVSSHPPLIRERENTTAWISSRISLRSRLSPSPIERRKSFSRTLRDT